MFSFDLSYYYLILLFLNCFVYAKLQFDSKPEFVSTSDDCVLKEFAWKFAQTRIDWLGELPVVFDALNLATQCGLKRPQTIANRNVLPMTPSPTSPIEFFVAPNGNDNNDGSLHNPFQTIEKGLATIRGERFNAKRQLLPAKLILRGGNYNLTSTIVITGADSNTEITRFQNEFVALRGSQPLSLQWQQQSASPNVYRAKLRSAPFQALFVDGERAVRARAPNANPATDGTRHWFKHALHWKSPRQSPPPTQINISTPAREPTLFPRFATALGGSVQQFTRIVSFPREVFLTDCGKNKLFFAGFCA